jgi:uncharacterized protein
MRIAWWIGAGLLAAAPVGADVKSGVEAWERGDYRRAVEEWRGPAIAGNPDAQFNLGQAHKLGRGVRADQALAEKWFRMAAVQGHEQAIANYAVLLFQAGRKGEALPWLEKAAARGEARSQLVLGTMLFNGDGTPRDYPRAYALVSRAMAAGLPTAADTLARMDQYLTPTDRTKGAALATQYASATSSPAVAQIPVRPAATPTPQRPRPAPSTPPVSTVILEAAPGTGDPAPMRVGAGGWGIQLGAFRERRNAEGLWAQMAPKFADAEPFYSERGGLIRVTATGYASKAAAQAACKRAGVPCLLVAP